MREPTIRAARPAEYTAVGEITVAAYRAGGHLAYEAADDYAASLADAAGRAREAELLVAVEDPGRLLGTVTVVLPGTSYAEVSEPGELEFRMLAVHPDAGGRGVGRALTRHVLDRARGLNLRGVVISSSPSMTMAHRLYESLGFYRTPERDWSPVDGLELVTYRLDLS